MKILEYGRKYQMRILKRVDVKSWIYKRALKCELCTSIFKVEHDYEFKANEAEATAEVECPVCKHRNVFDVHNTIPEEEVDVVEEEPTNPIEPVPPLTPPIPPKR